MERTRERFEFSGVTAMQPKTLRHGGLDDNTDVCVSACKENPGCSFVTASTRDDGTTTCRFGSNGALATMSRVADDRSRGVVVRSGRKQVRTVASPYTGGVIEGFAGDASANVAEGVQYAFKSYRLSLIHI